MKLYPLFLIFLFCGYFSMAQDNSVLQFNLDKQKNLSSPAISTAPYQLPLTLSFSTDFTSDSIKIRDSTGKLFFSGKFSNKKGSINKDGNSGNFFITILDSGVIKINNKKSEQAITGSSFTFSISNVVNKKFPFFKIKNINFNSPDTTNNAESIIAPFIDTAMIASISKTGNCDSCTNVAFINNRGERKYPTDYLITFDASRKLDDYTICKHIYKRRNNNSPKLKEMYRKVAPAWFAPHVGSQLKFQVINQQLTEHSKITVNDSDLFISNSSFESVVSNQLAATLLSSARTTTATANNDSSKKDSNDNKTQASKINKKETDSAKLQRLYAELSVYINGLTISPCSIAENKNNLIVIKSRIQTQFKTSIDVLNDVVKKFDTTSEKDIALSIKSIILGLDTLKPLVYSTPRLANRDFINIKVINANNEIIADDNIRTSFGLKIDYSAGVFLTGLRDDNFVFVDTTVRYSPDTSTIARDTSGNFLRKQIASKLNVGFGVLVHIYPRISSNYNIGITTGFMATTNLDLNILLGGSMMFQSLFGSNNRVAFSGGIAWGKVKRLSNAYREGYHTESVVKPTNTSYTYERPVFYATTGDPTVQVWRKSWFFAITYNFK